MSLNNTITQVRRALGLKFSYGLRAFAIYIVMLGGLGWFLLDHAVERLNDGMRQAAENVMVDSVNVLAALVEHELEQGAAEQVLANEAFDMSTLAAVLDKAKKRAFIAQIYQVDKTSVSADVYVTDAKGIIVYDSTGRDLGKNFSQWNDVKLTLEGEYGARTSFISRNLRANPDAPKAMIVAAPIKQGATTLGVISLATPIASLETHLATETKQMERTMMLALCVAILLGFVLSVLFSRSINKIATYADKMANGETVTAPQLLDQRLADLANSVANLRTQLDGKHYVEEYVHSLTHELKTPITGIQGAIELIDEGLPEAEQKRFLNNIRNSNQRMARLVERMLSLAKLESKSVPMQRDQFELSATLERLIDERRPMLEQKNLSVELTTSDHTQISGDRVLLSQAIANLLDNAIAFAANDSELELNCRVDDKAMIAVFNQGEPIPDFALGRIYERFFSLPSPNSNNNGRGKSTGLGLSFVREIMKLHRGTVVIENQESGVLARLIWPAITN